VPEGGIPPEKEDFTPPPLAPPLTSPFYILKWLHSQEARTTVMRHLEKRIMDLLLKNLTKPIITLGLYLLAVTLNPNLRGQDTYLPSPPAPPAPNTPSQAPGAPITSSQPTSVPHNNATDAARYLAGLPVSPQSSLASWTQDPHWIAHSNAMNKAFTALEQRQLGNIRAWRSEWIDPMTRGNRTCLYLFSGPDFLYADAFFPNCSTYILQGLEPCNPLPDLASTPQNVLLSTLQNIETSLNSVLNWSFFITKDMRQDFQRSSLRGTLPILFVFLARTGKEITNVNYVSLSKDGSLVSGPGGGTKGVKIEFIDPITNSQKTLFYFTADLGNDAIASNPGFVRFCSSQGSCCSFLKAASYLMFQKNFSKVRDLELGIGSIILQDDSGIPVQYFGREQWSLRLFGNYTKPIALFKQYYQPTLQQYFANSSPKPLTFGFGYQWNRHNSGIILATHK
jgi:hypothetical protein